MFTLYVESHVSRRSHPDPCAVQELWVGPHSVQRCTLLTTDIMMQTCDHYAEQRGESRPAIRFHVAMTMNRLLCIPFTRETNLSCDR
jgi:hypothetical protein